MFKALFEGILLGITLAILIGPSFFALIQTSISNGFRSGLALAFGIFLSDILCVFLAYFGASQFLGDPENKEIMGIMGGSILIAFGAFHAFRKKKIEGTGIEIENVNFPLTVVKGFFLNILNPFVLVFWLGAITVVSSKDNFSVSYLITFFSGTLLTVFATDVLKSYVALKLLNALKPDTLVKLNKIAGVILMGLGISLILRVVS